ncbi:LPXTG cell wall anchor domain-containing protein [Enterococcus casseliflavus]|uniref:LPXTG cell wall anchor domain-containing protein n=1 Tax=Enterococcus casseliflavus TaxID=37734 RepID=UPI0018848D02|nr:LPXTG cell wall anchor domain-containing protein [Enterococcus casseliflavus]MBE9909343.1 LPXTG cell wall anchor domain-containing protein [Enterococcus casseliflavus]
MIKKICVILFAGIILIQTSGFVVGNAQSVTHENNAIVSFFSPEEEELSEKGSAVELPNTGENTSYLVILGLFTLGLAWTIRHIETKNREKT